MERITTVQALNQWRESIPESKEIYFVPTMGALHEGHLSLVDQGRGKGKIVCVSIYLNPLQFNNKEDLIHYPSSLDQDLKLLEEHGANVVFFPSVPEMKPETFSTAVEVSMRPVLCHKYRPNHFKGVTTIVSQLLLLVRPKYLALGEKDYQQCVVLKKMIKDLFFPVEVKICDTVREESGLAMSSRNRRLSKENQKKATAIYQNLKMIENNLHQFSSFKEIEKILRSKLEEKGFIVEYATCLCADNLEDPTPSTHQLFIGVAVFIQEIRLIDHIIVNRDSCKKIV